MGLLWQLVALAAADSVNPCTFYIFATLLLALSLRATRRSVAIAAVSFIAGVYVGYLILGLGLATAGTMVPRTVFLAIALGYAGITVANSVSELARGKPVTPKPARLLGPKAVGVAGAAASLVLGFTLALTLLPCSGGPLVAFIYIAGEHGYASPLKLVPLLMLYNTIFVAPLVSIAIVFVLTGKVIASRLQGKRMSIASLASGILLAAIAVYAALAS
ncbi:hypothetical protein [Hyperthermus butylicus]|uniref:Cytochrome C biogenesis protein transmembrane domain-containing protein n=1 Tax=Hyperthermus butylicus (strain DSM 5456 / JCM 9403 / PLM1-5) TaxID=415426 RepID=A2BMH0_HYPBU|nr:hypothetical protein [Hyperthermus butylicus]ABM81181.1 hypothetical protein Hbut_1354 [Hyperthermus butylicus DSM 5456]